MNLKMCEIQLSAFLQVDYYTLFIVKPVFVHNTQDKEHNIISFFLLFQFIKKYTVSVCLKLSIEMSHAYLHANIPPDETYNIKIQ